MNPSDFENATGINGVAAVAAFIGAAASLRWAKELTVMGAISAVIIGTVAAVAGTPALLTYFKLAPVYENGIAFLIGLGAMQAVPVFFAIIDRVRAVKIPGVPDTKE